MIRKTLFFVVITLLFIAVIVACVAPTPTPTVSSTIPRPTVSPIIFATTVSPIIPTPTISPITPAPTLTQPALLVKPGSITGRVEIGGRSLYITCLGDGSPTVIFDSGWGGYSLMWTGALFGVSKHTQACAYDRAGLGKSDPASTYPRTSQDMVNDLHALLTNANIPGPYILVGHSLGGMNVRLYASQYPQDVVGLVFVDSAHPDQMERYCDFLPTEVPNENEYLKQARVICQDAPVPWSDWTQFTEGFDSATSIDQVRATGPFGNLPLVVLVAQKSIEGNDGTAPGLPGEVWNQMQRELAALSTQGKYQVVENTNHGNIITSKSVRDAIIEMVDTLRNQ